MSRLGAALGRLGRKRRPPLCFLHVPKCAGTSLNEALLAAYPPGSVCPRRNDGSTICDFSDFDLLDEYPRSLLAIGDSELAELADYQVVSGHFALPTLERFAPATNIATILREPRARMLSGYMFLRLSPAAEFWGPYGERVLTAMASSPEAARDPRFARTADNQVCRLILRGDPRMPDDGFVRPEDASRLAEAALDRLDRFGFVGILELDDIWTRMSEFFGVALELRWANVSGEGGVPVGALPFPRFDMKALLELLDERSRADRIVYDALLERRGLSAARRRRIADAAFATELVRFGDVAGSAATELDRLAARGVA